MNLIRYLLFTIIFIAIGSFGFNNYRIEDEIIFHFISLKNSFAIFIWIGFTLLVNKLLISFLYKWYFNKKNGIELPSLVQNFSTFVFWGISFSIFLNRYYGYDLTGLWATSSVTIAVMGFALRSMLMDFFSGLFMGLDRPFIIGDWIKLESGVTGKVISTNWRVTKILTIHNVTTILPNSLLANVEFQNLGQKRYFREMLELELDYDVTAHQAERILKGSANLIPELKIPKEHKTPEREITTRIKEFTPRGVKWQIRVWADDYIKMDIGKYKLQKEILKNLYYSGLKIPTEKLDLVHVSNKRKYNRDDLLFLLKEIDFFESLKEDELLKLSESSRRKLCLEGENIITIGEKGESFFILLEGTLSVYVYDVNSKNNMIEVAKIAPGNFFGEMSLLTGELRSATIKADVDSIVYEIKQEDLQPILQKRGEIAESLSEYIQKRVESNRQMIKKPKELESIPKENFLRRLKQIFKLK